MQSESGLMQQLYLFLCFSSCIISRGKKEEEERKLGSNGTKFHSTLFSLLFSRKEKTFSLSYNWIFVRKPKEMLPKPLFPRVLVVLRASYTREVITSRILSASSSPSDVSVCMFVLPLFLLLLLLA